MLSTTQKALTHTQTRVARPHPLARFADRAALPRRTRAGTRDRHVRRAEHGAGAEKKKAAHTRERPREACLRCEAQPEDAGCPRTRQLRRAGPTRRCTGEKKASEAHELRQSAASARTVPRGVMGVAGGERGAYIFFFWPFFALNCLGFCRGAA